MVCASGDVACDKRGHVMLQLPNAEILKPCAAEILKGVPGSECRTGGRLVGCRWSLEKKKMDFINFWPDRALLSTNVDYISSIYYIELKSTEIRKKKQ